MNEQLNLQVLIKELSLKTEKGTMLLLKNINFLLPKNKVYTIVGKNGVGKSTLIKSLTRLLDNELYEVNADITFDGKNIYSLPQPELMKIRRYKIKYVFQDAVNSFDPLRTFEFYFKTLAKNKNEIEELLNYFILPKPGELLKLYPYQVSGGMAQRISFVIGLLTHPELIILDEPTSGMDAAVSNLFLLKLKDFAAKNNNSVLLITQNMFFAEKVSDKIAYLSDGTLTDFYSVKEFFEFQQDKKIVQFLNAQKQLS